MLDGELRPFQRTFLRRAMAPGIDLGVMSVPRGNGKTSLAAHVVARHLTPGDPYYKRDNEVVLISGSTAQSRFAHKFIRRELEHLGVYRWSSSLTSMGARDTTNNVELRVMSSNPKTAHGLVGVSLCFCDEPSSWENLAGADMWDAILTAQGKPSSRLRVLAVGTRAPSKLGSWWLQLLDAGSNGTTYVQQLRGRLARWDSWAEIRRCNPLSEVSSSFRKKLLAERDAARRDDRAKSRFLSFRLNLESTDESSMLFSVPEWARVERRVLGDRDGAPIVGIDLAGGRSWSAATAIYPSGRVEGFAVTAGIPGIQDQERRDVASRGVYQHLVEEGALLVDRDKNIPRVSVLVEEALRRWPNVAFATCDRFRLAELLDAFAGKGVHVAPRVTRWSESSDDIRAVRALALDGNLSVDPQARALLRIALASAVVESDTSGNSRLTKRGTNQAERDDPIAALVLAAGALARMPTPQPFRLVVGHRAG